MKKLLLGLSAAIMLFAWGCATTTTGDPRQGGLFGWSEEKAQARIAEKRRILEEEERRTEELGGTPVYYPPPAPPEVTE